MRKKKIILWAAILLWAALIFYFSAMPADISSGQSGGLILKILSAVGIPPEKAQSLRDSLQYAVRKGAHFTLYTVLGLLASQLAGAYKKTDIRAFLRVVLCCAAYALSDEIHQLFVPGRAFMIRDILIDTSGAATGSLAVLAARVLHKRNGR